MMVPYTMSTTLVGWSIRKMDLPVIYLRLIGYISIQKLANVVMVCKATQSLVS